MKKSRHFLLPLVLFLIGKISVAQIITQTLSYTGASQTLAIPACVSQVSITCYGAKGANGVGTASGAIGGTAGLGAMASGVYSLFASGITLNVYVGGAGTGSVGGFNGGGSGNRGPSGAGGGASDIRVGGTGLTNRIIVAGGGGGGGNAGCASSAIKGGNGGSGGGGNGTSGNNSVGGGGGQGGNGTSGGATGIGCSFASGTVGVNGTSGQGGSGGNGPSICGAFVSGGGGGGGYFGGGGGGGGSAGTVSCTLNDQGGGGGGAGGTNYFSAAITNTSISAGVNNGNGYVVISYSVSPAPTISVNSGSVCSGNFFVVSPSGANSYTISGGSFTVNPMTTSSYSITGDLSGCPASNTVVSSVSVFITPTISVNSGSICSGSVFTLTPSGTNSYSIQGGSATVSPLVNSTYTVSGLSSEGCASNTVTSTVNVTLTPVVSAATTQTLTCSLTTITLNGSGASTYTWTGPVIVSGSTSANAMVASAGTYSLIGSSNGCTSSVTTVAVTANTVVPTLSISSSTTTLCEGNTATLTVGGADSYTWSTTTQSTSISVSPTSTSSYSVVGTNSVGCTNTTAVTVSVNPTPSVVISGGNQALCSGNSATLTVSGASSYLWNTSTTSTVLTITPATNSVYSVVGTSAFGCTNAAVTSITVNTTPTVSISASSTSICSGNASSLTASGASSYLWSTSATSSAISVSPGLTSSYTVIGTSVEGCTSTAVKTVTVSLTPSLSIAATQATLCSGNTSDLSVTGAVVYLWNTTSTSSVISVSPLTNTTYTVVGVSAEGCTNTAVVTLTVYLTPTVTIAGGGIFICSGNSTSLAAQGAPSFSWSTGEITSDISPSPNVTSDYTVTGISSEGCTATAIANISVNVTPTVTINTSSFNLCEGNSLNLAVTGAGSYSWSTNSTQPVISITPSITSNYSVVGSNPDGCADSAFVTITVNPNPTVTIAVDNTLICAGETLLMSASGAQSYSWTNGAGTASINVNPTANTSFSVIGFSAQGCTSTAVQSISVNALPVVTASTSSTLICSGETVTLVATGADNYMWSTASVNSDIVVSPLLTTTYTVVGTSTLTSCKLTVFITQNVSECTALADRNSDLNISLYPNPTNGHFIVEANTDADLTVSNLIGQILYSEKHIAGKSALNLTDLQNGVYFLNLKTEGKSYQQKFIKE
ncbi:hypothetical protein CNR22_23370 [Sphingobacteriaceae bacterium]|nr:hypothetical protein CNR22_23370 [Sphingobacteriaceae bacterium]